jgi:ATP-binding cassette, subfamily B, bacterial
MARQRPDADLPGALPSLGRALRLAYRAEPWLMVIAFALIIISAVPAALNALWLKLLADGVIAHNDTQIIVAAAGLAVAVAGAWLLRTVAFNWQLLFRERATVAIEAHVARLQAEAASLELHERPEYLDRLQVLKDSALLLNRAIESFIGFIGLLVQLGLVIGLLASVHPALVLLTLFAVPTTITATWRAGAERRADGEAAPHMRLARHLFELLTTAGPGKELRVTGSAERVVDRWLLAWADAIRPLTAVRWTSAAWYTGAWVLFGVAYVGALALVALVLHGSPGSILLVLAAGGGLSGYLGQTVNSATFLRFTLDAASRMAWLEDYTAAQRSTADLTKAPDRLERGMRVEDLSFRYPGTERLVLDGVTIDLPAGRVIAIVGENGAGKSTLVKLLCGLYPPTSGRILVDGTDLSRIPPEVWRARVAGAFQDFVRFEFLARRTVGLGDLPREEAPRAVEGAVERGGAVDVVERLPRGLDTQLGPTWADGVDVSFGQWQKLALARGFMRERPLLLVLDEPTAALDAETEHQLFERFAAESRSSGDNGRITILVSHRFSTVRMADLILVVDGARVVEHGSHERLMAERGVYADLYNTQARSYR